MTRGNVYIPPNYGRKLTSPLIFLAGPIQGAKTWQDDAIKYIHSIDSKVNIANPRRNVKFDKDFADKMYKEQVDWETFHLRSAGMNGAILFWLAKEHEHDCSRAYAQTTRFELAEWKMRHEQHRAKLVIGIEDGFTGARYIRLRFGQDCPHVKICSSLEETCKEAVRLAYLKK